MATILEFPMDVIQSQVDDVILHDAELAARVRLATDAIRTEAGYVHDADSGVRVEWSAVGVPNPLDALRVRVTFKTATEERTLTRNEMFHEWLLERQMTRMWGRILGQLVRHQMERLDRLFEPTEV